MKHSRKYTPYIRKGNPRHDRAESIVIAYRVAYFKVMRLPYYVLVQRGFPSLVLSAQASRREVRQSIASVFAKWDTFTNWARKTGRHARGTKKRGTNEVI